VGSGADPRRKTNFVHLRAVRKPSVAIVFSILKWMFYIRLLTTYPRYDRLMGEAGVAGCWWGCSDTPSAAPAYGPGVAKSGFNTAYYWAWQKLAYLFTPIIETSAINSNSIESVLSTKWRGRCCLHLRNADVRKGDAFRNSIGAYLAQQANTNINNIQGGPNK